MLFSETGMWPVKYRRLVLALRYWQYALSLPNDHFLSCAMADAVNGNSSWMSDLVHALRRLPHPISLDVSRDWRPVDIDNLIETVERSCLKDIDDFMASSPKALLLHHCSPRAAHLHNGHASQYVVSAFRSYLLVPIPAHRKALVRLLTSSHTLAVEVLRWTERRRPPIPRDERLCRYCRQEVEDEAHVLLYCDGSDDLRALRSEFFHKVFRIAGSPLSSSLRAAPTGFDVIRLLLQTDNVDVMCSFAKFVYNVFSIYQRLPVFMPQSE
ncbi:hypothetical protein EV421DRAFT_847077 [Armillaria borealis]|uniref:Uncharacterized protein n=1 Tax=Armillaria borealis TaxID=47425 RepID=A0AA39JBN9_9AGAR|nr:hypothetical protein EV421DRAFT_847077 [Armillaria borealis]